MADEENVVVLTYDARQSAAKVIADAQTVILSLDGISKKTVEVSASVAKTNENFTGMGRLVAKIAKDLEPWTQPLKNATAEANRLVGAIDSLSKSNSRTTSQDSLLEKMLALIPQVQKRLEELKVITDQTANSQQRLNSPAYVESIEKANVAQESSVRVGQLQAQIFGVMAAAADNYASILNHFRVNLDASTAGMSSFANAQELLANSTNRMTGEWNESSALMVRLTEKFRPGTLAASGLTSAMLELNVANKLLNLSSEEYTSWQQKIADGFNPVIAKAQQAEEVISKVNQAALSRFDAMVGGARAQQTAQNSQNTFNSILGVNPTSGAGTAAASASVFAQGFAQEEAELENVKRDLDATTLAAKNAADRLDYLTNKFAIDTTAAKNYKTTMAELNEVMDAGRLSFAEYSAGVSKAIDDYNASTIAGQKQKQSIKDVADAQEKQTKTTFLNRIGMLELQAAGVNTFQALASGMNITHVAMMEGAQVVGAFVQGSSRGLGVVGDALKFLITPLGLVVSGLVAMGIGFTIALTRANSMAGEIRGLSVALKTLGTDVLASGTDVARMAPQLQSVGLSRTDALSILNQTAQTQGINPQASVLIGRVGANFAATFGGSALEAAKKFTDALTGGVETAVKFALSVNALTANEASNMEEMARHGKSMEALAEIADKVDKKLGGNLLNTMSAGAKAVLELKNAWDRLITTFSNTQGLSFVIEKLTQLLNIIEKLGSKGQYGAGAGGGALIGGGVGTLIGGVAGAVGGFGVGTIPGALIGGAVGSGIGGFLGGNPPSTNGVTVPIPPLGGNLSSLQAANVNNKDIQDLNLAFAQRVNDFLNAEAAGIIVNSAARFGSHPSRFNAGGTGLHNADILGQGLAVDLGNLNESSASRLGNFGLHQTVPGDWGHIEPIEIPGAGVASAANRMSAAQNFISQNPNNVQGVINPNDIETTNKLLNDQIKIYKDKLSVEQQIGMSSELVAAKQEAENKALQDHLNPAQTNRLVAQAQLDVLRRYAAELDNTNKIQDQTTRGVLNTADAARNGTQAQIQAAAVAEATNQVYQKYGTTVGKNAEIQDTANRLLVKGAADAALAAQSQLNIMTPEIAAAQRLADATKLGAAAGHEQELQNQAIANTQSFANAAVAAGKEINDEMIISLQARNLAEIKKLDTLKQIAAFENKDIQSQNDIQVMQLQISLEGRTSQEISNQVDLLKEKQALDASGLTPINDEYNKRLQTVDAVGKMKIALDDATRAQQRLEDGIRTIADQLGTTLLDAMDGLFDKSKVTDWASTFKSTLTSIGNQLIQMALIKPLTGTILGALGFGNLAQQYGGFGSLFGGSGSGGGNSGQLTLTPNGSGGFNLSTLGTVGGIAKDAGGLFGLGGSGNGGGGLFGNLFGGSSGLTGSSNAGGLFGLGGLFGSQGPLFGSAADISILGGGPPLALGSEVATSGLGLGSAAGILGSLGSLLPIAGIAVGLGSLLFGSMLGGHKPSVSSGGLLDLATGAGSDFRSSGGPNGQAAQQMIQTLSDFTKQIQGLTGGSIQGSLNPQVFTNQQGQTTYRVGYNTSGPFGSGKVEAQDAQTVINMIELGIARSLTGVSDTVKQVLSVVTDPSQIQDALNFAKIYDNLKTAADSAFSSLSEDTQQIGPFKQALDQINATFADISTNAAKYGLSLDPVNAGLKEATARLIVDVNKQVSDMILNISNPAQLAVEQLKKTNKALLDDVIAVGADAVQAQRYNTMALNALWKSQTQTLVDLQNQLLTGSNSGLTLAKQVTAANENFKTELRLVRGGNIGEIGNLATSGQNLIGLATSTYGNAPQTATIRSSILSAIDDVLKHRGFAGGTSSTPEGFIRVGENGPEWIGQSGNMQIMPNGINPKENKELVLELRAVRELLEVGNRMTQGVGSMTVNKLEKIASKIDTKVVISEPKRTKVA